MSKIKIAVADCARELLNEFVENMASANAIFPSLSQSEGERFIGKVRLYRLAILINALRTEEKTVATYGDVLIVIESSTLPSDQSEAIPMVVATRVPIGVQESPLSNPVRWLLRVEENRQQETTVSLSPTLGFTKRVGAALNCPCWPSDAASLCVASMPSRTSKD